MLCPHFNHAAVRAVVASVLRTTLRYATRDIRDEGFGLTTMLRVPGAGEMMLYQPKHPLAHNL